jgi:hypothetical protein
MIAPHHEELNELYAYWLRKKGRRRAPGRSDIDPAEIAPLMPYVGLVDVVRAPLRFRYRLLGTEVVRGLGIELTGRFLDEVPLDEHQRAITSEYARVAERAKPVCATWEYTRADGRHVRYERLGLPLMSDGKTVDMLFGGAVFEAAYG